MKRTIVWMSCLAIIVLLMSTGVQAKELRVVSASEILKQIEKGEVIFLENVTIRGELDLSKIDLKTVPNARPKWKVLLYELYYLEKELKIVESNITIQDSAFEDYVDFSNTEFRKDIEFIRTSFLSYNDFLGANFAGYANFSDVNFTDYTCFEEANFAGYANFSDANFTGDANFNDVNFTGVADFNDANFAGYASFGYANFAGDAYFNDANFTGGADFNDANFTGYAYFNDANFTGDAGFGNANFARDTYFLEANFTGDTSFGDVNFAEHADLQGANFAGIADFWKANFASDAYFMYANFTGNADFGHANFADHADFGHANFAGNADFWKANFANHAYFMYANFAGNTYFWEANFARDARFRDANFTGNATFLFTEFDKVYFTGTTFTNVSLNETDFNQMNVEWSTLKDALVFDGHTYIKLIKNFREMEQFKDADAAYYQYRRLSQANKKWSYSKLMDVVAGVSCGYGVKPEYPLIWGFILIIVFALVYKLGNGIKRLKLKENCDNRVSFWDAFYFSLVTFTTVGYGDWYPEDRYRKFVMIEGVLGWLLLALFIVTLANVMIRP